MITAPDPNGPLCPINPADGPVILTNGPGILDPLVISQLFPGTDVSGFEAQYHTITAQDLIPQWPATPGVEPIGVNWVCPAGHTGFIASTNAPNLAVSPSAGDSPPVLALVPIPALVGLSDAALKSALAAASTQAAALAYPLTLGFLIGVGIGTAIKTKTKTKSRSQNPCDDGYLTIDAPPRIVKVVNSGTAPTGPFAGNSTAKALMAALRLSASTAGQGITFFNISANGPIPPLYVERFGCFTCKQDEGLNKAGVETGIFDIPAGFSAGLPPKSKLGLYAGLEVITPQGIAVGPVYRIRGLSNPVQGIGGIKISAAWRPDLADPAFPVPGYDTSHWIQVAGSTQEDGLLNSSISAGEITDNIDGYYWAIDNSSTPTDPWYDNGGTANPQFFIDVPNIPAAFQKFAGPFKVTLPISFGFGLFIGAWTGNGGLIDNITYPFPVLNEVDLDSEGTINLGPGPHTTADLTNAIAILNAQAGPQFTNNNQQVPLFVIFSALTYAGSRENTIQANAATIMSQTATLLELSGAFPYQIGVFPMTGPGGFSATNIGFGLSISSQGISYQYAASSHGSLNLTGLSNLSS